jgi:hypothetical protein
VSAAIFLLTLALWARTFFAQHDLRVGRSNDDRTRYRDLQVRLGGNFVHVSLSTWTDWGFEDFFPATRRQWAGFQWSHESSPPARQGLGSWIWWDHYVDQASWDGTTEVWRVQVRPWLLLIPPAVLPALWVRRVLRRRRLLREGRCLVCGYDLRATAGRCPECGAERAATV